MSKYIGRQYCEVCNHLFRDDSQGFIAWGTLLCNSCYCSLRDAG